MINKATRLLLRSLFLEFDFFFFNLMYTNKLCHFGVTLFKMLCKTQSLCCMYPFPFAIRTYVKQFK